MPLIQFLPIFAIGFVLWHLCFCLIRTAQRARKNLMNICPSGTISLLRRRAPHHHHHHHHHHQIHQQSTMEDLTEIFTLPAWQEINGTSRCPWDHDHGGTIPDSAVQSYHPHQDMLQSHGAQMKQNQGPCHPSIHGLHNPSSLDVNSANHQAGQLGRAPGSESGGMSESSGSPLLPPWHQAYFNGRLSVAPLGLGQVKSEAFMLPDGPHNSSHLRGKREHDHAQAGPSEGIFIPICGARQLRTPGQQPHSQVSHGMSTPSYSSHTGIGQPQGAAAVVAGTARPRVRARRGQATDPHSIAERLRRERIADRMKALQELVPNANKTDKASMLDEIIEYVRFLQLQVKILSMSRLSGTSAVVSLVTDIPGEGGLFDLAATVPIRGGGAACSSSQDTLAATERQVARLMEESMGSALQFLQGKGLCLMPVSLAAAAAVGSTTSGNARPATGSSHGRTEASSTSMRASMMTASPVRGAGDTVAVDEVSSAAAASRGNTHAREAMIKQSTINPMANTTKIKN